MVTINSLMETIKKTAVGIQFLKDRLPKDVDVVSYEKLKGKDRRTVFKGKRAVVILIPKKGEKLGHFVVCLPRENHIEYFSSLGNDYKVELQKLGEASAIFDTLLGKQYIYNRVPLQSKAYHINDCAAFVLSRVYLSHLKLREFVKLFQKSVNLQSSDDIVALMTVLHFVNSD